MPFYNQCGMFIQIINSSVPAKDRLLLSNYFLLFSPNVTRCKSTGQKSSKDCKLEHYIDIA